MKRLKEKNKQMNRMDVEQSWIYHCAYNAMHQNSNEKKTLSWPNRNLVQNFV